MALLDTFYVLIVPIVCISTYLVARFFLKAVRVRSFYRDVPGLAHDPIWGHMKAIRPYMQGDRHFDYAAQAIWRDLGQPPFFYMDAWPVMDPSTLSIGDAELAESIQKATPERPYSFPRPPTLEDLKHVIGRNSILWVGGEHWKSLRKRYNPGFSSRHLHTLLPEIIRETKVFVAKLDESVGQVVTLGDFTTSLTIDIICAVVLGDSLGAQRAGNKLTYGFKGALDWQLERETQNLFHLFNPLRPLALWYYEKQLNAAIDDAMKQGAQKQGDLDHKSVLALTLANEKGSSLSPDSLVEARDQIKTFLLAGFDTTSSALQWLFYELSLRPQILARLRAEHRQIFGSDPTNYFARVDSALKDHPEGVFAEMSYTNAVFKEVLRLRFIAGGTRFCAEGTGMTADHDGKTFSFDGHVLYMPHAIYHGDERLWGPDAKEFNPDRWFEDAEWKIPAYAFRPFEKGPRACIGQELVYIEVRVILAYTINSFAFDKVFDTKYKELYAIRRITAKPNDGMRMRVTRVEERPLID